MKPSTLTRRTILAAAPALLGCAPSAVQGGRIQRVDQVQVEGARLYLEIRGQVPGAPVLVWLHGGPGGAERPLFRLFNGALEDTFVVAYLDQRGAGRSFDPQADPGRLTIARHLADLDAVVDHLRRTLDADRVILLGHSWGTALGLLYAQAHPEKVAAFLGVGQMTSERARQAAQFAFVGDEARRRGDADALTRLGDIGPPPFSAAREIAVQRLVERYGGYWRGRPNFAAILARATLAGDVRPWELPGFFRGNDVSLAAMNDELLALDLRERVPEVQVPVAFLLGRFDRQVDSRLAADYFKVLKAPAKRLVWFETAHNVPFEAPARFNAEVPATLATLQVYP